MTTKKYTVVIEKAPGNYSAYVPDLPGCVATGGPAARIGHANVAGQAPDEIAHDWDLSLAQVHAALSYYYTNRGEIDAAVRDYDRETLRLAREASGA